MRCSGSFQLASILKAFGKDLDSTLAKDILLPYTFTVGPNVPLSEAIQLMDKRKIEHIIVTSDRAGSKAVLGVLHIENVISAMVPEEGSNKHASM